MKIQFTKRNITAGGIASSVDGNHYVEINSLLSLEIGEFLFVEAGCFFGVLPPYSMLNSTLMKGRLFSAHNTILEWKPMRLSRLDYEELQASIKNNPQWGGEVDERFRGSRKYWERWAILRSLEKMTLLGGPV
ncbi:MAG: hypothetical protein ACRBCS_05680 [Cellvibrionaceae bacterium]